MTTEQKRWVVSAGVPVELVTLVDDDGTVVSEMNVAPIDEILGSQSEYAARMVTFRQTKADLIAAAQTAAAAAHAAGLAAIHVAYDELIVLGLTDASARAVSGYRGG